MTDSVIFVGRKRHRRLAPTGASCMQIGFVSAKPIACCKQRVESIPLHPLDSYLVAHASRRHKSGKINIDPAAHDIQQRI